MRTQKVAHATEECEYTLEEVAKALGAKVEDYISQDTERRNDKLWVTTYYFESVE